MDDLSKIGGKYVRAENPEYSVKDHIGFFFKFVWVLFKTFVEYLPYMFDAVKDFIVGVEDKNIEGEIALVTGGANGLGREIAIELAKVGCNLVIVDVDLENAVKTASEIKRDHRVKTIAFKADVSDYESIKKLKTDIESNFGCVDILVNNAGILPLISLREGSNKDIQKIIDVNLASHFWTCRTFLNGMIKRKRGHIVAVGSAASFFAIPRACAYVSTKFGVRGFMNALYLELCADGFDEYVNLTTVCPSFITTRQEVNKLLDSVGDITPRLTPSESAKAIVKGILKNKTFVPIPGSFNILAKIVEFLPSEFLRLFMLNTVEHPEKKFMDNGL